MKRRNDGPLFAFVLMVFLFGTVVYICSVPAVVRGEVRAQRTVDVPKAKRKLSWERCKAHVIVWQYDHSKAMCINCPEEFTAEELKK